MNRAKTIRARQTRARPGRTGINPRISCSQLATDPTRKHGERLERDPAARPSNTRRSAIREGATGRRSEIDLGEPEKTPYSTRLIFARRLNDVQKLIATI